MLSCLGYIRTNSNDIMLKTFYFEVSLAQDSVLINIIINAIDINSHLVDIYLLKVLDVYYLSDGLVITFHVLVR